MSPVQIPETPTSNRSKIVELRKKCNIRSVQSEFNVTNVRRGYLGYIRAIVRSRIRIGMTAVVVLHVMRMSYFGIEPTHLQCTKIKNIM